MKNLQTTSKDVKPHGSSFISQSVLQADKSQQLQHFVQECNTKHEHPPARKNCKLMFFFMTVFLNVLEFGCITSLMFRIFKREHCGGSVRRKTQLELWCDFKWCKRWLKLRNLLTSVAASSKTAGLQQKLLFLFCFTSQKIK